MVPFEVIKVSVIMQVNPIEGSRVLGELLVALLDSHGIHPAAKGEDAQYAWALA